ncbi:MAG: outer membrane beta-barrel protein [Kofleriaceae bacterium]|nr:outer membrane beta-barrel protein [Kofleriaceae bacterium]
MPAPEPMAQPTYEPAPAMPETPDQWADKYGVEVALGGGVSGFTNNVAQNFTDTGGDWNVHVGIGNTRVLGFEGSYIGSAQGINALGLDSSAILVGNGVQGLVRVNLMSDYTIRPFGFAGAAWRHYNLTNTDVNTSDIDDSDDVLEVPLGAGVAATYSGFLFDLRGEYRVAAAGDSLIPNLTVNEDNDAAGLDRWGFNANIGYQF